MDAIRNSLIALLWLPVVAVAESPFDWQESEQEFLHPDKAFVVGILGTDSQSVVRVHFEVAEGYYLYRDKMRFALEGEDTAPTYRLPAGVIKEDPLFGRVQTYPADLTVTVQLDATDPDRLRTLQVNYQGCAEQGVCYPPQMKTFQVAATAAGRPAVPMTPQTVLSQSDQIAQDLAEESLWWSFLAFMGFGLLLAFTPCVLPMIPILASVIAGAGATTRRAVLLSLIYVLAMASTYALLGIVIGLTGSNLQASMQNAWVIGAFVVILLLLALAMFGVYELRLPAALHQRLHQLGDRFHGGSYIGAGAMGFLGAIVASPCVSPPLVGALIHIADTGSPLRGAISLFAMGLGLGLPLFAFGAFEGCLMPRSGPWMVRLKSMFGVLLLALAIWMLDRVVPDQITVGLAGVLLLLTGVVMRAVDSLPPEADAMARVGKGLGLVLLLYGAVLLIGAAMGGKSLLRPLPVMQDSQEVAAAIEWRSVQSMEQLQRELQQAEGQPVLFDFYADWCVTCQELESFTFSNAKVQQRMRQFVLLKADVTDNTEADQKLLAQLGLFGPPAILFYAADKSEMRAFRTVRYVPAREFGELLDNAWEMGRQ